MSDTLNQESYHGHDELKKAHAEEKAKLTERHKEEEKTVKGKVKKKEKIG